MACKHLTSPSLKAPTPDQLVYREDCTLCFDSIDDPKGLDVCLFCFNGACPAEPSRPGHSEAHIATKNHPLVVNIKRTRKHVVRDEPPQKISKLAIAAETEADRYDTNYIVKCYECGVEKIDVSSSPKLEEVVNGVLKANTFARQQEIKGWQLDLSPCEHTLCLEPEASRQIASQDLAHCSQCELKQNLWLCLTCGNLGCGRAQHGGIGGNSHGVAHNRATGHPIAVKLGSLTADGTADIYCYACDEERLDPELHAHLAHWGINIADRQKTEKSLTEMQIEENMRWDFAMKTEDGKEMKPVFGAGLTGLKNLGNSCYMNSILQSLFAMPEFAQRYYLGHPNLATTERPAEDLETQLEKVADGLLSGRYAIPDPDVIISEDSKEEPYQRGLAPSMLKSLVGKGHPEFSTMRQQDSMEFLRYLFKLISSSKHPAPLTNPLEAFKFGLEQRLQCLSCKKVRYMTNEQENISVPVPIRPLPMTNEDSKEEFETVSFAECLDKFTAPEHVEFKCPSCKSTAGAAKQSRFVTLPSVLTINTLRFKDSPNWVPTKLDVPVDVPNEPILFDSYLVPGGPQTGEELLPEDGEAFEPNPEALANIENMGFPTLRAIKALHATGNSDAEAATMWLMDHMDDPDIDAPLQEPGKKSKSKIDEASLETLTSMGFNVPQARQAMRETGGNVNQAIDWLFSNSDAVGDFEEEEPSDPAIPGTAERPAKYQLHSIVCHKGTSIHAGHYVAFIRKIIPGEKEPSWVLFNDEKVAKAVDAEELKKFAYIYFFRRVD